MKDLQKKNVFLLPGKTSSAVRNWKIEKNWFKLGLQLIYEKLGKNGFHQTENPFPLAKMKDWFQKYVSIRRKRTDRDVWKIDLKNGFH